MSLSQSPPVFDKSNAHINFAIFAEAPARSNCQTKMKYLLKIPSHRGQNKKSRFEEKRPFVHIQLPV